MLEEGGLARRRGNERRGRRQGREMGMKARKGGRDIWWEEETEKG